MGLPWWLQKVKACLPEFSVCSWSTSESRTTVWKLNLCSLGLCSSLTSDICCTDICLTIWTMNPSLHAVSIHGAWHCAWHTVDYRFLEIKELYSVTLWVPLSTINMKSTLPVYLRLSREVLEVQENRKILFSTNTLGHCPYFSSIISSLLGPLTLFYQTSQILVIFLNIKCMN